MYLSFNKTRSCRRNSKKFSPGLNMNFSGCSHRPVHKYGSTEAMGFWKKSERFWMRLLALRNSSAALRIALLGFILLFPIFAKQTVSAKCHSSLFDLLHLLCKTNYVFSLSSYRFMLQTYIRGQRSYEQLQEKLDTEILSSTSEEIHVSCFISLCIIYAGNWKSETW